MSFNQNTAAMYLLQRRVKVIHLYPLKELNSLACLDTVKNNQFNESSSKTIYHFDKHLESFEQKKMNLNLE